MAAPARISHPLLYRSQIIRSATLDRLSGRSPIRRHWREPAFWRWYIRNRVPIEAKVFGSLGLLALIAGGGYVLSSAPTGGTAGGVKAQAMTIEEQAVTVEKQITVGGRTRTIRQRVPVVQRVIVPGAPGTTRVLTTAVTQPVRVLERRVVTADGTTRTRTLEGPTSTVVRTITGQTPAIPTTRTVTSDREVTTVQTVTGTRSRRPVPSPPSRRPCSRRRPGR